MPGFTLHKPAHGRLLHRAGVALGARHQAVPPLFSSSSVLNGRWSTRSSSPFRATLLAGYPRNSIFVPVCRARALISDRIQLISPLSFFTRPILERFPRFSDRFLIPRREPDLGRVRENRNETALCRRARSTLNSCSNQCRHVLSYEVRRSVYA